MTAALSFGGSIPELYDQVLGPFQFEPYARDLVGRLAVVGATNVLETACGTGLVTRHLRAALPVAAALTSTDLSPSMLAYAEKALAGVGNIRFQAADMTALPFTDGEFDLLIMQFGLMFVPEPAVALHEARRVAKHGSRYLCSTWQSLEQNPAPRICDQVIRRLYPTDPPGFYQVPFRLHQVDLLHSWFVTAGFTGVHIDPVDFTGTSASVETLARGFVAGTPAISAIRERGTISEDQVIEAIAVALEQEFGSGPLEIPLRALVIDATAE